MAVLPAASAWETTVAWATKGLPPEVHTERLVEMSVESWTEEAKEGTHKPLDPESLLREHPPPRPWDPGLETQTLDT